MKIIATKSLFRLERIIQLYMTTTNFVGRDFPKMQISSDDMTIPFENSESGAEPHTIYLIIQSYGKIAKLQNYE